MEGPIRKFTTELVDQEAFLENQKRRTDKAIDVFDVVELKRVIEFWRAEKDEEYVKQCIKRGQDLFRKADVEHHDASTYLWNIMFESEHPYFASIRDKTQKDTAAFCHEVYVDLLIGDVPEDAWLASLASYREYLLEFDSKLKETAPNLRKHIVDRFVSRINPDLDNPKNEEDLIRILGIVQLEVRDPLRSAFTKGSHNSSDGTIDLDLATLMNNNEKGLSLDAQRLIAHEALHAISGGQVVRHALSLTESENDTTYGYNKINSQWTGLQVSGFEVGRFTWLNEAITEILAGQMIGTAPVFYEKERKLLELLLVEGKKKIDIKVLKNAYFEKRGYQIDETKGQKYWNQMRQEIREAYDHDSQFLIKLDILVQHQGIDKALEFMRDWDPENLKKIDIKAIEGEAKTEK